MPVATLAPTRPGPQPHPPGLRCDRPSATPLDSGAALSLRFHPCSMPQLCFVVRRFGTVLLAARCAFLFDLYGAYDGDDVSVGLKTSNFWGKILVFLFFCTKIWCFLHFLWCIRFLRSGCYFLISGSQPFSPFIKVLTQRGCWAFCISNLADRSSSLWEEGNNMACDDWNMFEDQTPIKHCADYEFQFCDIGGKVFICTKTDCYNGSSWLLHCIPLVIFDCHLIFPFVHIWKVLHFQLHCLK
jgi:hypothetical protein